MPCSDGIYTSATGKNAGGQPGDVTEVFRDRAIRPGAADEPHGYGGFYQGPRDLVVQFKVLCAHSLLLVVGTADRVIRQSLPGQTRWHSACICGPISKIFRKLAHKIWEGDRISSCYRLPSLSSGLLDIATSFHSTLLSR